MCDPRFDDRGLHRPLRSVVGNRSSRGVIRSERAHQDEALDPGVGRGRNEIGSSSHHDTLEILGAAGDDRDEVNDGSTAFHCERDAREVGDVAFDEFAAEPLEVRRVRTASHETSDGTPVRTKSANDPLPDKPGRPSDEDHSMKFCQ